MNSIAGDRGIMGATVILLTEELAPMLSLEVSMRPIDEMSRIELEVWEIFLKAYIRQLKKNALLFYAGLSPGCFVVIAHLVG